MDNEIDLYDDLDFDLTQTTVAELLPELEKTKLDLAEKTACCAKLEERVRQLEKQNALLTKKSDILLRNISCLFNTSQEEIKKRDLQLKAFRDPEKSTFRDPEKNRTTPSRR